jgi:hypothetical protein
LFFPREFSNFPVQLIRKGESSLVKKNFCAKKKKEMENTMTNDDAVVDCIVYANEVRMGNSPEGIRGTRAIKDPPPADKDCSISMCGEDDDPLCRMLRYCSNGHCMHDKCLEYMFKEAETLSTVVCPQCRSEHMVDLVIAANPIQPQIFKRMWSDNSVAARGIKHFVPEVNGVSMLPMLMVKKQERSTFVF